ncbi:MAG TPA: hypothetical protein VN950_22895 [Terriglobales bacterium]|nr:hypothetical protein [Terriglobales bacterium]
MSSLIHLPNLAIQPQTPEPLGDYQKLASIQALQSQTQQKQALAPGQLQQQQQELEAGLLDNQQKQRQLKQSQAMDAAFQGALTPDPVTGAPKFDSGKVLSQVAASGNGSLVPQLTETFNKIDQEKATLLKTKQDTASAQQDYMGSLGAEIKSAGYSPAAAGVALAHLSEVDPNMAAQLRQQFSQDPTSIQKVADAAIAASPKQQEAIKNAAQAKSADTESQLHQAQLTGAQQGGLVPGVPLENQEATSWLAQHPGKTLADYQKYAKTLVPAFNFSLQNNPPSTGGAPAGSTPEQIYNSLGPKAGVVKAIVEGRQSPPSGFAQKTPYWQGVMQSVYQIDPQWSEQRAQIRKAFTTGADGRNIGALNTASVHLDALDEAAQALDNGNFKPGNQAYNYLKTTFGGDAPTTFEGVRNAVSGEMASALKGNATDSEIAQIKSTISGASSPKQLSSLVNSQLGILGQKLQTYKERYEQQIPGDTTYTPVLPSAQAVFQKHGVGQGAQSGGQTPPAQTTGHKVGDAIVQNGRTFKATKVDKDGKVLAADPQ